MNKERLLKGKIPCAETGIEVKKSICDICTPTCHCGLDVYVKDGKIIKVEGNQEHKTSHGSLCSKGSSTRQYVYSPDRIMTPLKRIGPKGSGEFAPISWEEAYKTIAEKFNALKDAGHPEYASFYVGYSKWMRPYVQRLCRTFGSPNYSTESSTCHKAMYMAWKLVCGAQLMPDTANSKTHVIWTANPGADLLRDVIAEALLGNIHTRSASAYLCNRISRPVSRTASGCLCSGSRCVGLFSCPALFF